MHAIAFGLKRAFQSCLRISRRPFAAFGITAARFDMLFAISHGYRMSMPQRELREWLGVTAATISRMLRSLESLGYVSRARSATDRRRITVALTDRGKAILRSVFASLVRGADLAFDVALTNGRAHDESASLYATDAAESMLRLVRSWFSDVARLHYAWDPDD